MSQWKDIVAIVGLSLGTALAGTACLAPDANEDSTEPEMTALAEQDNSAVADENTGEAHQAWIGFGGCGFGWGGFGWGGFGGCGFGWGGFGGCGFGWGGFGGCGFGWGGFGWGGFGGCGCW
jgi:hypothetical protein